MEALVGIARLVCFLLSARGNEQLMETPMVGNWKMGTPSSIRAGTLFASKFAPCEPCEPCTSTIRSRVSCSPVLFYAVPSW
ncbi:hypothetical protein F4808DRAFT_427107 [Astrocystis sublimbata]|nr:hypothetical protein F4808DRAFT_427107 [Astrocystis sublimbata]